TYGGANPFYTSAQQYYSKTCRMLDTGWYTVVSSQQIDCRNSTAVYHNSISVTIMDTCMPTYNKPHKVYVANNGQPLTWGLGAGGKYVREYPLPQGCFSCTPDPEVKRMTNNTCSN